MAATSAALATSVVGNALIVPRSQAVKQPAARFTGLRACPLPTFGIKLAVRQYPRIARRLVIRSAATEETLLTVREIIAKQLSVDSDKVEAGTKFADLGADSLDTVEIMMALELQFNVNLDEDGAEKITTVQEAADLIENVRTQNA